MLKFGYWGLFLATFLAATVLPFSSEAMLSGMLYADYNLYWVLLIASFGNWLGGMTSYYLGYLGKIEWIEKYLRIPEEKTKRFQLRIKGKEQYAALFCWLPFVGDIIAVVLGLIKLNPLRVAIGMFIGKALRYIVWAYLSIHIINQMQ